VSARRTPSSIKVTLLDLSSQQESADAWIKGQRGEEYRAGFGLAWGIVETPEGLFAICTEGVGPDGPITAENPLHVDIYAEREGFIAIVPCGQMTLDADDVRKYATGPEVPLAEHVRTFGARLEANYEMWLRRLSPLDNARSLTAL
jgi:hypothetical protein